MDTGLTFILKDMNQIKLCSKFEKSNFNKYEYIKLKKTYL